jgi:hypothetical protein
VSNLHKFHHDGGWSAVPNKLLEARELSWRAKGLWSYIYSRPDGWEVREGDLIARSTDGRDGVRSILRELEEHGYLTRTHVRERGQFSTVTYKLHLDKGREPLTELPSPEEPSTARPTLSNTEESKTETTSVDRAAFARHGIHWLSIYPERQGHLPREAVLKTYIRLRESGVSEEELIDALANYTHWCKKAGKVGTQYVYSPVSFLSTHWRDWLDRKPVSDTVTSTDGFRYLR